MILYGWLICNQVVISIWISIKSKLSQGLKVKVTQSCPTLCDPMDYTVHGILQARMLEWVAFPFSRGSSQPRDGNSGLQHCRGILYQLSHKGSPRILEWVPYPFSSRSSWRRNWSGVSCTAGGFFTNWAIKEALTPGNGPLLPLPFGGLPISNPLYHVPRSQRWTWDSADLNLDLRLSEAMGSWGWITCWQGPEDAPQFLAAEELP